MYRPVGSTSAYSASTTSSPEPNTSIPDQPRQSNDTTSERERERKQRRMDQRDRRRCRWSARGSYALGAAAGDEDEGEDGAAGAGRSVKGSENGAYDGRMRRQRRLRSDDVGFARPATPMARHPAEDTRQTQHLILPRSASSRRRTRNPWEEYSPRRRRLRTRGGGGAHGRSRARWGQAELG